MRAAILTLALAAVPSIAHAQVAQAGATRVIDDFEQGTRAWSAHPSDGTHMSIADTTGRAPGSHAMRVNFTFAGGGYAIVRKELPLDLPDNYELSFWIRGVSRSQNLEVKLVDSTGENVWWVNQRDMEFPHDWKRIVIKKRQISFAWGPLGGGDLKRAAALEISITAGSGGDGTIWFDDIVLEPRAVVAATPPRPAITTKDSTYTLDFRGARELGGLIIDWAPSVRTASYDVQTSPDGSRWETAYAVRAGNAGRDYVYLPETEARFLRLALHGNARAADIRNVTVEPIAWAESRNAFFEHVAHDAPHGDFPKYFDNKQSYWTIIGTNGDDKEALINEQGMIEVDKAAFSLEPSLFVDGRYLTWADVSTSQSLEERDLPIPTVTWRANDVRLSVTAFAVGAPMSAVLWVRYRVRNDASRARTPRLFVALRPFQVNPPAQFLNTPGGASIVRTIANDGHFVTVTGDAKVGKKTIVPATRPSAFGAITFDAGGVAPFLRRGTVPTAQQVTDSLGAASAAFAYDLALAPRDSAEVWLVVPFHAGAFVPLANQSPDAATRNGMDNFKDAVDSWRRDTRRVTITLPPSAARITETLNANLAYMLITRDGPALQPGARSYERSWIRDGAMMTSALLRLGHAAEARQYIEWYARYQYPNGKVPCCVDTRGADPVPENDSHGELIFAIAEYFRYTQDTAFLTRMWPHVASAVTYIDSLRQSRMTAEFQTPEKRAYFGLVPQSISHEGYSAKPMHSYWDDAFTLRGLRDAADIATALHKPERDAYAAMRDGFRHDLMASYERAMAEHKIDYLPGSVELGDFDATSTTVSIAPGGELEALPHPAVERTFEKYYQNFITRRDSGNWTDYTPYELRVVGSMVRLGWKSRAQELLDFFFQHQRPAAWRAWAEVVYRDSTATKFIGDLPHAWVGSDYIRSVLDMFAYERESDSALVLGAGVPAAWVQQAPGLEIRHLVTYHGALDFSMRATGDTVTARIIAERAPPGGFVLTSPLDRPLRRALVNGAVTPISSDGQSVVVRTARATVRLEY